MLGRVVRRADKPRAGMAARPVRFALLALLASLGLALATAIFHVSSDAGSAVAAGGAFPVTLTDDLGRSITLSRPPQRIVSLAPSNTEILFAIGAGSRVVGVTNFCNYPPEVQNLPRVGGMVPGSLSLERVVSLRPDLVLSVGNLQRPIIDTLQRLGIPVFAVESNSLEDVYENLRQVGRLTGHGEGAEAVIETMRRQVEAIRRRVADIPASRRLRVFYQVWDNPLMTAGPGTFIGQLIELAGGVNVFDEVGSEWPQVSLEELVRRDPDVILGPKTHGSGLALEELRRRPGWQNLRAVRTRRVHLIDDDLISRPGPRLAEGLEQVARALYPERFAQAKPVAATAGSLAPQGPGAYRTESNRAGSKAAGVGRP